MESTLSWMSSPALMTARSVRSKIWSVPVRVSRGMRLETRLPRWSLASTLMASRPEAGIEMDDRNAAAVGGDLLLAGPGQVNGERSLRRGSVGIGTEQEDLIIEVRYQRPALGNRGDEQR